MLRTRSILPWRSHPANTIKEHIDDDETAGSPVGSIRGIVDIQTVA